MEERLIKIQNSHTRCHGYYYRIVTQIAIIANNTAGFRPRLATNIKKYRHSLGYNAV
jgi:hypothetical protein